MSGLKAFALFVACTCMVPLWGVEITSMPDAINVAGKQRMFSQRLLKDYAMIGMNNPFGHPKEDMQHTIEAFEANLKALEAYAKDAQTKAAIADVKTVWKSMKAKCETKPELSVAKEMQQLCNKLLEASDKVVKSLVKTSGQKNDAIVDLSGRQRMLSQRMASLYMLKVWGADEPHFHDDLMRTIKAFKEAHEKLKASALNDDAINAKLNQVGRAFMFFEMMSRSHSKFVPSLIYKKSNDILKMMDEVTHMYEKKLSKKEK